MVKQINMRTITLYDLWGKILKIEKLMSGNEPDELSLAGFPAGEYFIAVRDDKGEFLSNKIVRKD